MGRLSVFCFVAKAVIAMAAPTTLHQRNIVLVGQDGAGKTSLAEAMLYVSGRTNRMGTTHDGKSFLDYDDEEIRRRFTLGTSIAPVPYKDYKINLLDTSGQPDFICDTLCTMAAAEMAMFVIDAVTGPQPMHNRLWHEAELMRLSRSIFVNHIDREGANFDLIMAQLHARFGSRLGAITIPIGVDSDFCGVIDVLRGKARYFEGDAERIDDIPADYVEAYETAREKLCDLVAEADEDLMMKYLDGDEQLTQEELEQLLDQAIAQELFIPVYVGSTLVKQGIQGLMEDICTYFPHPRSHGAYPLADGGSISVDETGDPSFVAFKTIADPFVGRLSFVKVLSGYLEPGQELIDARTGRKERIGHLYVMLGKEPTDVKSAKAGDIIVIPKLADVRTGDTLSVKGDIAVQPLALPRPQYPVCIEAESRNDEDKLSAFLVRQVEVSHSLRLERNEETGQQVLYTMGDLQVDVLLNRLKAQTGIEARLAPVRIAYRETIRKSAQAQGRHKKQTGGSGQFGDCWLRVEPNPGAGYEFVNEVFGGHIPKNLIPAVDKGVQEALAHGPVAGFPMVDVKVACFDGSYHAVDSNEMAFKTAARIAFKAAVEQANPVVLEPYCELNIVVGEAYAGAVMGDISTRRGRIIGTDSTDDGDTIVVVRAPYAEVLGYTKDLRAMTRGSGSYSLHMLDYEPVPREIQQRLEAEHAAND